MSVQSSFRLAALATALLVAICGQVAAQERWAAIAPNLENTASVVWATTKEQAKKLALLACKDSSSTCSETPASTNRMSDTFAVMCCTNPQKACAAAVAKDRSSALKEVKKLFSDNGFERCSLKSYFKAGTGEKG